MAVSFTAGGEITVTEPVLNPLLTVAQAAELASMAPSSWRSLVARGMAPKADDPGDLAVPANRRNPRWRESTVIRYRVAKRSRAGRSARVDPDAVQD